jgi:peptidyl-prolyl cis-trans isomerase C
MARFLLSSLAVLALLGCQKGSSSQRITLDLAQKSKGGTPLATFKGGAITVEDVNRQLSALPPMVRMRLQGTAARKDYVEGLVRVELLAQEGIRQGLQNDPEVVETVKKVLAQKTLQQTLEKNAPQPTDEEVKAWYDNHQADYQRPELVQVQDLFLTADSKDPAKRKARAAEAEKLHAKAKSLKPDDEPGFATLVKASSDDALTKQIGGDLRPMPLADLEARYGTEVGQAAKALQNPGDLSPVVATEKGFHVLRLKSRLPARTQSLDEVKMQIRNRLFSERRTAASEELLKRLKTESGFTLDETALAQVAAAPAGVGAPGMGHPGMGPMPGGMPGAGHPPVAPPTPAPAAPQTK